MEISGGTRLVCAPGVEDGRVYVASPGMHTTSLCLDLETGKEIWKSTQTHPLFGIYKYPAIMSTPVILSDKIILREVNSHGGNEGQARNLVYLDKKTGKTLSRKFAGHIDYRTQVAPVASNGKYTVYPFGVHDIYGYPAVCQNFNRLICADAGNEKQALGFQRRRHRCSGGTGDDRGSRAAGHHGGLPVFAEPGGHRSMHWSHGNSTRRAR